MTPNGKLQRIADASVEPLSLAEAKAWLRLETSDDDATVSRLVTAARQECENIADRSFITTTWRLTLDYLPFSSGSWVLGHPDAGIVLPRPPLVAVSSLDYIDTGGNTITWGSTQIGADLIVSPGVPGRLYPAYGTYFPLSEPRPAAVRITYTAGYGDTPADVPAPLIQAIAMLAAFYYEHRSEDAEPPRAVVNLIDSVAGRSYA
jgi:uncharacterized phiE125 gp8 family phage protein